jgi:hypothetical protein
VAVVDADVDELPAGLPAALGAGAEFELALAIARDAVPGASAADPGRLLDVDVDQFSRALALVAVGRLRRRQCGALAEPDPPQPPGDRGERHAQHLGDLGRCHPQSPQSLDCL